MLVMNFDITIGAHQLNAVESVSVTRSIENLADTAKIVLPATINNVAINVESKIAVGDAVCIKLGYGTALQTEFEGYIDRINTDNGSIEIECIDALYFFKRVSIPDAVLQSVSLNDILNQIVGNLETSVNINCDYSLTYEKFTFYHATAYDVLKKIQEDTKADIYFDGSTLHIHPVYSKVGDTVKFDFSRNIESSELKYIKADDRKLEIEVNYTDATGAKHTATAGTTGGEKKRITVPADDGSLGNIAENWYNALVYDGYEGSFTGWLVPYVKPTDIVSLHDADYNYKDGNYYVIGTEVEFSSSGGKRKIELGRKMS